MKHRTPLMSAMWLTASIAAAGQSTLPALAAEREPQALATATVVAAGATVPVRGLNPAQLTAIRGVGRHVLAAKKSGQEDSVDAVQLASLRASLDALIAADLDPQSRASIPDQGQDGGELRKAREKFASLRESARSDLRALATQLHHRGELKPAHARSGSSNGSSEDTRSAGLPIGEQRARLFERWAQKLDIALAEGKEDRVAELLSLREQLRPSQGGLIDVPTVRDTPTLQAMPADYVQPQRDIKAKE